MSIDQKNFVWYPEDYVSLLAPEITQTQPEEFYAHVVNLFAPRSSGRVTTPKIKGKVVRTATKKRLGIQRLTLLTAMGERSCEIEFSKPAIFCSENMIRLQELLLCTEDQARAFFGLKKFTITSCQPHETRLKIDKTLLMQEEKSPL